MSPELGFYCKCQRNFAHFYTFESIETQYCKQPFKHAFPWRFSEYGENHCKIYLDIFNTDLRFYDK